MERRSVTRTSESNSDIENTLFAFRGKKTGQYSTGSGEMGARATPVAAISNGTVAAEHLHHGIDSKYCTRKGDAFEEADFVDSFSQRNISDQERKPIAAVMRDDRNPNRPIRSLSAVEWLTIQSIAEPVSRIRVKS
jgi:hypothetical protein